MNFYRLYYIYREKPIVLKGSFLKETLKVVPLFLSHDEKILVFSFFHVSHVIWIYRVAHLNPPLGFFNFDLVNVMKL